MRPYRDTACQKAQGGPCRLIGSILEEVGCIQLNQLELGQKLGCNQSEVLLGQGAMKESREGGLLPKILLEHRRYQGMALYHLVEDRHERKVEPCTCG